MNFRFIIGLLAVALLAGGPATARAAKHRQRDKSPSTHSRRERAHHSATKRRAHDEPAKRQQHAGKSELGEIERRWSEENVEPDLPE